MTASVRLPDTECATIETTRITLASALEMMGVPCIQQEVLLPHGSTIANPFSRTLAITTRRFPAAERP